MDLDIDFRADWAEIMKKELGALGFPDDGEKDAKELTVRYFNAVFRRVPALPRCIQKATAFACPANLVTGLHLLETKVTSGDDLTPHLSRLNKKPAFNDLMLNSWHIYHFHLGTKMESDGYVERSNPLLFALVDGSNFFEIGFFSHGAWTDTDIVETIHRNWPESILQYRIQPKEIRFSPSTDELRQFHKDKLNAFIQVDDGSVYMPMGGGFTADGKSLNVVIRTNQQIRLIDNLEQCVRENIASVLEELGWTEQDSDTKVRVALQIDQGGYYAILPGLNCRMILVQPSL